MFFFFTLVSLLCTWLQIEDLRIKGGKSGKLLSPF